MDVEPEHLDGIEPVLSGHRFRAGQYDIDHGRGVSDLQVSEHRFNRGIIADVVQAEETEQPDAASEVGRLAV